MHHHKALSIHTCKHYIVKQTYPFIYCIIHDVSSIQLVKGRATSTARRAEESLYVASEDSPEMATSHPQPQPNDVSISNLNVIS